MLEEKVEHVMVGEALIVHTEVDFMKLNEIIAKARWEVLVLEDEERAIQRQLENMKKVNDNSF